MNSSRLRFAIAGRSTLLLLFFVGALALHPVPAVRAQPRITCLECHGALDPPLQVTSEQFARDIHYQKGLSCIDCHGGDPTQEYPDKAMSRSAGFRGKIERAEIPVLCARCHADAAYMRKYNPSLRTDQLSQYRTSVHGKLLAKGDSRVAVCTDCQCVHDIQPASDARSPVHPLNVAQTCARCHASPDYMKGYSIATDQFASYSASVHHEALVVRGDLSAPTCTTCHGNHGAAPPGVGSVEFVCSTCHVFQAQLFDASPHKAVFAAASLPACVTCHSNHRILHPTDAMLGTGEGSVCLRCHSQGEPGYEVAGSIHAELARLEGAIQKSDEVLGRAERSGMEVSQAKLELDQARDALIKARVATHSFSVTTVDAYVQAGVKVSEMTLAAGMEALAERNNRRKCLAFSLLAIVAVLAGLWLLIRQPESGER